VVTMREVADAAGVSAMTVSNALTGRRPVSEETTSRIQEAVQRLGYQVNVAARDLRLGRTGTVGLAVPTVNDPYFSMLSTLLVTRFAREGLRLVIEETSASREGEMAALRGSRYNAYDGLLLSAVGLQEPEVDALRGALPVVVLGEKQFHHRVDHVSMDNVAGAAAATQLLLDRGCRHLALVGAPSPEDTCPPGDEPVDAFLLRAAGFAAAVAGVDGAAGTFIARGTSMAAGARCAVELVERRVPVDGYVCVTDTMAFGVLRGLADSGVRVPDDALVIGFDDVDQARYNVPSLSTVAPGHESMVEEATRLLLRRMADRTAEPEHHVGPFAVVERESTRRPGGAAPA
jgi:DNA-binding LacI/PurR family transcriptional regulator